MCRAAGWLLRWGGRFCVVFPTERLAELLGEKPGETVGYRMRAETCIGPNTRLEGVTEGILTRMIQRDPELTGVGLVILDEFHERSLQADLALALLLEQQRDVAPRGLDKTFDL